MSNVLMGTMMRFSSNEKRVYINTDCIPNYKAQAPFLMKLALEQAPPSTSPVTAPGFIETYYH
jgi:hypothetical protein